MTESPLGSEIGRLLDSLSEIELFDDSAISTYLDKLVGQYPPEVLSDAVLDRLGNLEGRRGQLLLAIVEVLAREELWDALADSILRQPDLSPDLIYLALENLEGTGRIESHTELIELREEFDDELENGLELATLAEQLEDDPNSLPLALDALMRIDGETRVAIIGEIANEVPSVGMRLLLESLIAQNDVETRFAAAEALGKLSFDLAPSRVIAFSLCETEIIASVIGPISLEGIGEIGFLIKSSDGFSVAHFRCDVERGILGAGLCQSLEANSADRQFDEIVSSLSGDVSQHAHGAALSLVSGSAWLGHNSDDEEVQAAIATVFGSRFIAHPIFADLEPSAREIHSQQTTIEDVHLLFDRNPQWIDCSDLTNDLALEMDVHDSDRLPDPRLDPGPFRVLFEGRILEQIDLYRRILFWTAAAWSESRPIEALAVKRLAIEMSDPQNAVPGHPFLEQLMIRSLCQAKLRIGLSQSQPSESVDR